MFIVSLTYQKPLEVVESYLSAHIAFLDSFYAKGIFIASGRKVPRTGGVILAHGVSRSELEEVLENDPFKSNGIAIYEITEFVPSRTAPDFRQLLNL
jgi:uncharacterized protein YciI